MSHSITAKLNQAAREHANQSGVMFFVSLGEKNYDFKTKTSVWTNYDAALFAKDGQVEFCRSALVEGAIIEVSGSGVIMEIDPTGQHKPKLVLQDAKLGFVHSPNSQPQQNAPSQQPQYQQPQQGYQAPSQQPAPPPQNQPQGAYHNPGHGFNGQ